MSMGLGRASCIDLGLSGLPSAMEQCSAPPKFGYTAWPVLTHESCAEERCATESHSRRFHHSFALLILAQIRAPFVPVCHTSHRMTVSAQDYARVPPTKDCVSRVLIIHIASISDWSGFIRWIITNGRDGVSFPTFLLDSEREFFKIVEALPSTASVCLLRSMISHAKRR